MKNGLATAVAGGVAETYPEPIEHCDVCRWNNACDARRRADDHLSLVAGISRLQIVELGRHDAARVTELAAYPAPFPWKPARGAVASYERVRDQARIQVEARDG